MSNAIQVDASQVDASQVDASQVDAGLVDATSQTVKDDKINADQERTQQMFSVFGLRSLTESAHRIKKIHSRKVWRLCKTLNCCWDKKKYRRAETFGRLRG